VGASGRILGKVWVFEHGVHDGLRAHDLARCENSIQDGFAGRLPAFTNLVMTSGAVRRNSSLQC